MININNVVLTGRLTKDIDLRKSQNNTSVCSFTVAVNRRIKNENGEYEADFINCVAWKQSADFLHSYAAKGDIVSVEGRIQMRSYEGQNGKVYVTEVVADNVQLISSKKERVEIKTEAKWDMNTEQSTGGVETVQFEQNELPFY